MKLWAALAAILPLAAQDLYLVPSEFRVSPGQAIAVEIRREGADPVALESLRDATLYTAAAAYNITSLRADGERVVGRAVVKGKGVQILAVKALTGEFAKALILSETADETWGRRAGHALEIVPLSNPFEPREGGVLTVEVLWRGKPASGVPVRAGVRTVPTDESGQARVPVPPAGPWRLHASVADGGERFSATLAMEVQ